MTFDEVAGVDFGVFGADNLKFGAGDMFHFNFAVGEPRHFNHYPRREVVAANGHAEIVVRFGGGGFLLTVLKVFNVVEPNEMGQCAEGVA